MSEQLCIRIRNEIDRLSSRHPQTIRGADLIVWLGLLQDAERALRENSATQPNTYCRHGQDYYKDCDICAEPTGAVEDNSSNEIVKAIALVVEDRTKGEEAIRRIDAALRPLRSRLRDAEQERDSAYVTIAETGERAANYAKQAAQSAAENKEFAEGVLKLTNTVRYLIGIAERGEGRSMSGDETAERFVLRYVQRLEQSAAELERVRKDAERYRWLRIMASMTDRDNEWTVAKHLGGVAFRYRQFDLDSAIDQALASREKS